MTFASTCRATKAKPDFCLCLQPLAKRRSGCSRHRRWHCREPAAHAVAHRCRTWVVRCRGGSGFRRRRRRRGGGQARDPAPARRPARPRGSEACWQTPATIPGRPPRRGGVLTRSSYPRICPGSSILAAPDTSLRFLVCNTSALRHPRRPLHEAGTRRRNRTSVPARQPPRRALLPARAARGNPHALQRRRRDHRARPRT
jgi:hypothetical protein